MGQAGILVFVHQIRKYKVMNYNIYALLHLIVIRKSRDTHCDTNGKSCIRISDSDHSQ